MDDADGAFWRLAFGSTSGDGLLADANGDGRVDLLVGAEHSAYNGTQSGSAFLVFGQSGINADTTIDTFNDGANGIRIDGPAAGISVDLSDVNGDGCADILVGAHNSGTGKAFVVFGGRTQ